MQKSSSFTSSNSLTEVNAMLWFFFFSSSLCAFLLCLEFSVAAGSSLQHMGSLYKETYMMYFFKWEYFLPSLLTDGSVADSVLFQKDRPEHTSHFLSFVPFFFLQCLYKIHPTYIFFSPEIHVKPPSLGFQNFDSFYQVADLSCTLVLTDSICNVTTTCVAAELSSCLNELLLLMEGSNSLYWMIPAPDVFKGPAMVSMCTGRWGALEGKKKKKKPPTVQISVDCQLTEHIVWKKLSPNRSVHITECGVMTAENH